MSKKNNMEIIYVYPNFKWHMGDTNIWKLLCWLDPQFSCLVWEYQRPKSNLKCRTMAFYSKIIFWAQNVSTTLYHVWCFYFSVATLNVHCTLVIILFCYFTQLSVRCLRNTKFVSLHSNTKYTMTKSIHWLLR